jgi:hypothetical protein
MPLVTIQRQHPPGLHPTPTYHHVTIVEGRRDVHQAFTTALA